MRLEPFCRVSIPYGAARWHRPYSGEEGLGFGQGRVGHGRARGRRRLGELPAAARGRRLDAEPPWDDLDGRGDEILVSVQGQSVEEGAPGHRRAILARVELTTEAEPWRC